MTIVYFEAVQQQKLSRCPNIIRKLAGDETYDTCDLNSKPCLIEHGLYECEEWDRILAEWIAEERDHGQKAPRPKLRIEPSLQVNTR